MKFNRIKAVLKEKQRPNKWLAKKLNKSQVTISRWCSNVQQPSLEDLYKAAEALKVDVSELLESNTEK